MTEQTIYCPYCGGTHTEPGAHAYLEMGEYENGRYDGEGSATGRVCKDCHGEFWIHGPAMPAGVIE
jgi:hypothetical protein